MVCELDGPTPILKRSKTLQTKLDLLERRNGPEAAAWQARPFVLLDDARPGGRAFLHSDLRGVIETRDPEQARACLAALRGAGERHAAGFIGYEAGHSLEQKLKPRRAAPAADSPPLLWFGLFDRADAVDVEALLPDPAGGWAGSPRPLVTRSEYEAALAAVMRHIEAGDIYQANLTFRAEARTAGHPLAVYAAIRGRARAGHGGIVFTGSHWILSFSPELFFTLDRGRVTARPMKGTAERRSEPLAGALFRVEPGVRGVLPSAYRGV